MPLNVGDAEYGSVPGPSETTPLLIPEPEVYRWRPMSKEKLEVVAGGPGWRKARCYLVLLFWLSWLAMLATTVAIVILSPRPVVPQLQWWQRSLFYQLQPRLFMEAEDSEGTSVVSEQLPYLRSLGIGALILGGLFDKKVSPLSLTALSENLGRLAQIQHLIAETNKANFKVVLDFCDLDLLGPQDAAGNADEPSDLSTAVLHAIRFWLEQGVAGFAICDTDAAYSEKTLEGWRSVLKEFSSQDEERIVVVEQRDVLHPLSNSSQINDTLVDVVIRSILPHSQYLLSSQQVARAIETHLQTQEENIWLSWTVGGNASHNLKKLLLVLMMTLPGSPVVQYDEEIAQTQDKEKLKSSADALFTSLSHARTSEEALLYGSFTFLPFNITSYNSTFSPPSSPPILAFLRSWGCAHLLILLNVGPEPHALDPAWASSLPEAGMFVASTGMDRLGSTSLYTLNVQPHEAIIIKLFQGGSYS